MKVGKFLKEECGFDNEATFKQFVDRFDYSPRIFNKILNDCYPVLLTCHIEDLSLFTGVDVNVLNALQELDGGPTCIMDWAPMGKPYRVIPPKMVVLDIHGTKDNPLETVEKHIKFIVTTLLEDETKITFSSQEKLAKYLSFNSEDVLYLNHETFSKDFNVELKSWAIEVIFKKTYEVQPSDIINAIKKIINSK